MALEQKLKTLEKKSRRLLLYENSIRCLVSTVHRIEAEPIALSLLFIESIAIGPLEFVLSRKLHLAWDFRKEEIVSGSREECIPTVAMDKLRDSLYIQGDDDREITDVWNLSWAVSWYRSRSLAMLCLHVSEEDVKSATFLDNSCVARATLGATQVPS